MARRCDILVNNAGVHEGLGALERGEAEIRAIFDVNVLSHFWSLQAFLPGMLARDHGHVVTVGSAAGVIGVAVGLYPIVTFQDSSTTLYQVSYHIR